MLDPELSAVIAVAIVILIRTFLSFSLEVEIEGRLPVETAGRGTLATIRSEGAEG